MNTLVARGYWNIAKGKLKQKVAKWAADDLQFSEGKEAELLGRIQMRKGRKRWIFRPTAHACPACRRQAR